MGAIDHHSDTAFRKQKKCSGWDGKPDCKEVFPVSSKREKCLECQYQHDRVRRNLRDKEKRARRKRANAASQPAAL